MQTLPIVFFLVLMSIQCALLFCVLLIMISSTSPAGLLPYFSWLIFEIFLCFYFVSQMESPGGFVIDGILVRWGVIIKKGENFGVFPK